MHVKYKKEKSSLIGRLMYWVQYKIDLNDVLSESGVREKQQQILNKLTASRNDRPTIQFKEITTHVAEWNEFTIEHLYADMRTFDISKKDMINQIDWISDIEYDTNMTSYRFLDEKGHSKATIHIDDFKIVLSAWEISDGQAVDILTIIVNEIEEFTSTKR